MLCSVFNLKISRLTLTRFSLQLCLHHLHCELGHYRGLVVSRIVAGGAFGIRVARQIQPRVVTAHIAAVASVVWHDP